MIGSLHLRLIVLQLWLRFLCLMREINPNVIIIFNLVISDAQTHVSLFCLCLFHFLSLLMDSTCGSTCLMYLQGKYWTSLTFIHSSLAPHKFLPIYLLVVINDQRHFAIKNFRCIYIVQVGLRCCVQYTVVHILYIKIFLQMYQRQ